VSTIPLDLHRIPLHGSQLVEASAGTGKTYTITSLYLRLLLESRLAVSEILVVTFTEGASQDLRIRIRHRIRDALRAMDEVSDDVFLSGLINQLADRDKARTILLSALRSLDEAVILTIHGFCQRILQESAFESSLLFDTELSTDSDHALNEIVDDFWRINFYDAPALFIQYAEKKKVTRTHLYRFANQVVCRPFLSIIPEQNLQDLMLRNKEEEQILTVYQEAGEMWKREEEQIKRWFDTCEGLNRRIYSGTRVKTMFAKLTAYLTAGDPLQQNKSLKSFCHSVLVGSIRRNQSAADYRFFEICEVLHQMRDQLTRRYDLDLLALKQNLVQYLRRELRERNRRQNQRFFDDLLLDLLEALQGASSAALKKAIRHRYRAVLIDEFQDTDPVQYAIFDTIYAGTDVPLFLVGDPKQAIYSFRGADLFSYLRVARGLDPRFTLEENWRSSKRLVNAVNTLFQRVDSPFVFKEILFSPVRSAKEKTDVAEIRKEDPAPLKFWFLRREPVRKKSSITKGITDRLLPDAVASEVVKLLRAGSSNQNEWGDKGLLPHDIAILVRTNKQASWVQEALRKRGVPSVVSGSESVFTTLEALELERVLLGIAECGNEYKVRAALSTNLLGMGTRQLISLEQCEDDWEAKMKVFSDYRDLWLNEGFTYMSRALMTNEGIRANLLAFSDGERRLTNLLHLLELLQERTLHYALGVERLLQWLSQQRQKEDRGQKEGYQVRLESDDDAVTVVTVHRSKGLEYSVVFCPFCWSVNNSEWILFHNGQDGRAMMDIGSEDVQVNRRRSQEENLAEEARLLYVAITRAKHRCYLIWGALKDAKKSPLAYLIHPRIKQTKFLEDVVDFDQMTDEEIQKDLEELARQAQGSIEVATMPEPTTEEYLPSVDPEIKYSCRRFKGKVVKQWEASSFSRLVSGRGYRMELPDRDAPSLQGEPKGGLAPNGRHSIVDFPKGIQAGNFFHELFETLDFSGQTSLSYEALIQDKLCRYGFEGFWKEPVCQTITRVLSMPLTTDLDRVFLLGLDPSQRLHEMAFSFPAAGLSLSRLQNIFTLYSRSNLPKSFLDKLGQLDLIHGDTLMKGFIDLIFQRDGRYHLIDWKSNFLGSHLEDYSQSALTEVMDREWYFLQYHLYVVALHRHLTFRLPNYDYDRDFGGVFYIFLRGVNPDKDHKAGVYVDRPPRNLILALDKFLMPDGGSFQQGANI